MSAEALPDFFAAVPAIVVADPLAALLGAAEGGRLEYRYADAVRLAGHSCPTVAGAWLMARKPWVVPIPGTTNPAHLAENVAAVSIRFSAQELQELDTALAALPVRELVIYVAPPAVNPLIPRQIDCLAVAPGTSPPASGCV